MSKNIFAILALFIISAFPTLDATVRRLAEYWEWTEGIKPFFVVYGVNTLLYLIFRRLTRWPDKALAMISAGSFLFFQFARVFDSQTLFVALTIVFGLIGLIFYVSIKSEKAASVVFSTFITISLYYCVYNTQLTITFYEKFKYDLSKIPPKKELLVGAAPISDAAKPDLYYILIDAYASADTLKRVFGYDNSPFLDALKERGFHVANNTRAAYPQTLLSISSTLNMDYVHNDIVLPAIKWKDRRPVYDYYMRPRLTSYLKKEGYDLHALAYSSRLDLNFNPADMEIRDDDFNLTAASVLLEQSPIPQLLNLVFGKHREFLNPYRRYEQVTKSQEKELEKLMTEKDAAGRPRFVFSHFLYTHPPFIFDENGNVPHDYPFDVPLRYSDGETVDFARHFGEKGWNDFYKTAYIAQMKYGNKVLLDIIDKTLAQKTGRPKVIILTADHGSREHVGFTRKSSTYDMNEAFGIINAIYYSDGNYKNLNDSISPINTLRATMNKYFGFNLPMVEQRQYYSSWHTPYDVEDVTERAVTDADKF